MSMNPPTFLPPVLAVGSRQSANGRQQLGSGLVTHRGIIDMNSLRVQGVLYPQSGAGLELIYFQTPQYPRKNAIVQSYDRDASQYTDLQLSGQNIVLSPTQGGSVTMPPGTVAPTIGTPYNSGSAAATPQANVWFETPVSVTGTVLAGTVLRVSFNVTVTSSTTGAICYVGFGWDGAAAPQMGSVQACHVYSATAMVPISATVYVNSPGAGSHRFSVYLYGNVVVQLSPNVNHSMWVLEQRA